MDPPLFAEAMLPRLPLPLYRACLSLMVEISRHGEESAADELTRAIEESVAYVGRVLVAEYVAALRAHPDILEPDLNADILEQLCGQRPLSTGSWLALSRRVRARFLAAGVSPVVAGLLQWVPGEAAAETPLARLVRFRNEFSHGGFMAGADEVRQHVRLLHDVLAAVPGLIAQVPVAREVESGRWFSLDGRGQPAQVPEGDHPAGHPVIPGPRPVDLFPLLAVSRGPVPALVPPSSISAGELQRARPEIGVWLERYERERQGHLPSPETAPAGPAPEGFPLAAALSGAGLMLVEAPPGALAGRVCAALAPEDPWGLGVAGFAAVIRLRVGPGLVTQSGVSVARALLRVAEQLLGERPGARDLTATEVLRRDGPVGRALDELNRAGRRVLLFLGDLHHGTVPYRGEPLTVRDFWNSLAGRPITAVGTAWPGVLGRPVFDQRLRLPFPAEGVDEAELAAGMGVLMEGEPLRRRVLRALAEAGQPLDLPAICDAVELDGGGPVFEPAVERAAWDLAPILRSQRMETGGRDRTWTLTSPSLRRLIVGPAEPA
jgi:hypothetical protein